MRLRHSPYSCSLLLVCQLEQRFLCRETLLELWSVCGKLVTGVLCAQGWGFTALSVGAGPLPFLRPLEPLPWCKERNHFSYNCGNLFGSEKFVLSRHTGKLSLSPCSLLPVGSCAVRAWLLFNLRGLLLVITACRHWERFSPGLLGGVSLEKDEEGGGRKVLLWILQPFSANSCNYRLCVLSQWHIIQQKPFLIETLQEVQIPPLFSLTN